MAALMVVYLAASKAVLMVDWMAALMAVYLAASKAVLMVESRVAWLVEMSVE